MNVTGKLWRHMLTLPLSEHCYDLQAQTLQATVKVHVPVPNNCPENPVMNTMFHLLPTLCFFTYSQRIECDDMRQIAAVSACCVSV
jgi:hypothetical protein